VPETAVSCLVFIDVGNYITSFTERERDRGKQKSEDIKLISGTVAVQLTGIIYNQKTSLFIAAY